MVEYGLDGERVLCDLPRNFWKPGTEPEPEQLITIAWDPDTNTCSIEPGPPELERPFPATRSVFVDRARQLLGFEPGDKVLLVVGPNPEPEDPRSKRFWLKNAGWGELVAMTRLPYLLVSMGIQPADISTVFAAARQHDFNPQDYGDRHILFLGSIASNIILRDHYWKGLPGLADTYQFLQNPTRIQVTGRDGSSCFSIESNLENWPDGEPDYEKIWIKDYFLVARSVNPYATHPRFKCLLSCGAGTVGTGYGAVVLYARDSISALLRHSAGADFHMVGQVAMHRFFDPRQDPVKMVFLNGQRREQELLSNALSCPGICDLPRGRSDARDTVIKTTRDRVLRRYEDEGNGNRRQ